MLAICAILELSNTDNKLVALAINGRLSALCQTTVADQQRGFVAGRHIENDLFHPEASAIALGATNRRTATAIFFDVTTAFPALAHAWIFFVLETMGVPRVILNTIRKLYTHCIAYLMFGGCLVGNIPICSGIKQGCSLSESIFALAIDPLIRSILAASVLRSTRITAFADPAEDSDFAALAYRRRHDSDMPPTLSRCTRQLPRG